MFFPLILVLFLTKVVESRNLNKESVDSSDELTRNDSKLLIILVDGFRWDYISRDKSLKGFPRIAENGVHAQYVRPIYPSDSNPNWYTISTGLYGESHGMIQNYIYDKIYDEYYFMAPDPNVWHSHWWNQTEPLWINAEKHGLKTSMYVWEGCQVTINGTKASFCYKNMGNFPVQDFASADRITRSNYKKILDDFSQEKYRLSFLYYELVDRMGHDYGPSSDNVTKAVQQIDAILNDLYNEIIERKLDKTVNVVIVSDHGMTDLNAFKRIHLEDNIDFNNIELMLGWTTLTQIIPKTCSENEVYNQLSSIEGIKVYPKSDIPQQLHYKNNRLVLPILVKADFGYYIEAPKINSTGNIMPIPSAGKRKHGDHGYDGVIGDMHAIMYGFGPAFKKNFTSEPIEMVDHYNLFCHLLGITPHPNNGTFAKVETFLKVD